MTNQVELKVAATTESKNIAGAIAGAIREGKDVVLSAIGAGATNQAIKGIAIANGYLGPNGIHLAVVPAFDTVEIEDDLKTALKLTLKRQ